MSDTSDNEQRLPLIEERISIQKRRVETGRVRIRTVIDESQQWARENLVHDDVQVERVSIDREIKAMPQMREEGDTLVIPIVEEVLITEKRLVLKEEIHIHRHREVETVDTPVTVRSMRAIVERDGPRPGEDSSDHRRSRMTQTLTALFDSRADVKSAERRLTEIGVPPGAVHVIDQESSAQSTTAREPMGFWAKLKQVSLPQEDRDSYEEGVRRGGIFFTASVDEQQVDRAITALEQCNPVDLERRQEEWRRSGWSGAQATRATAASSGAAQSGRDQEEVIPVAEERLRVGKREVNRGGVRARAYVVEEPVQEDVRLREEHVEIERRPVNQPAASGAEDRVMQERTVEMSETAEVPVVQKETQVKEELVVRKRAEERVETVKDKVRHTEVDVEKTREDADRAAQGPRPSSTQRPRH